MAPTTLHLVCGRIAAGKTTLARQIAAQPGTILLSLDDWMSVLYPTEVRALADFSELTTRLRRAMAPHLVAILRQGVSIALDFPANTVRWRGWMREVFDAAGVHHALHLLDVPDALCRERLRARNASGEHVYTIDDATYDAFMEYFVPPAPEEGFNVIVHRP